MNYRNLALLAAFITSVIYGINYTIAKDVMPLHVKPYGFIVIRIGGALVLFWIMSLFVKKQPIDRIDYFNIFLAAVFGVAMNMLAFFKGLSYTSPINAAVIMVTSPILVLLFSTLLLKYKLTRNKILGVLVGLFGAVILIVYGKGSRHEGEHVMFGNFLVFVNAAFYSFYLILAKKLIFKYHPFTFIKWLYLFGFIIVLPFGLGEALEVDYQHLTNDIWLKIAFVVVGTTFINYLFNLLALTKLKPTTVSVFIYLQPLMATLYALYADSDQLSIVKILATLLIFTGVYLVTKPIN